MLWKSWGMKQNGKAWHYWKALPQHSTGDSESLGYLRTDRRPPVRRGRGELWSSSLCSSLFLQRWQNKFSLLLSLFHAHTLAYICFVCEGTPPPEDGRPVSGLLPWTYTHTSTHTPSTIIHTHAHTHKCSHTDTHSRTCTFKYIQQIVYLC